MEKPKVIRPWGGYTILKKTSTYWVKKLFINANARLSLQNHAGRTEVWYVLSGSILAQIGRSQRQAWPGDIVFVPKHRKHRITGIKRACILEVAFGKVFERDIIRFEDDYGRVLKQSRKRT